MSSHHPHSPTAQLFVPSYDRADQIRASYPGDREQSGSGSAAENLAVALLAPVGSYVSGINRSDSRFGNYMSTRPSDARPGTYTSTESASYRLGSYIDLEPTR